MRVRRLVTQISEDQGHFTVAGDPGQVATNGDETERSDDALADIYTSRLEDGGVIESTDQGRNQTELITILCFLQLDFESRIKSMGLYGALQQKSQTLSHERHVLKNSEKGQSYAVPPFPYRLSAQARKTVV